MSRYGITDWVRKEFALKQVHDLENELHSIRSVRQLNQQKQQKDSKSVGDVDVVADGDGAGDVTASIAMSKKSLEPCLPVDSEALLYSDVASVFDASYPQEKEHAISQRRKYLIEKIEEIKKSQSIYQDSQSYLEELSKESTLADPAYQNLLDSVNSSSEIKAKDGSSIGLDLAGQYNEELQMHSLAYQRAPVELVSLAERRLLGATLSTHIEISRVLIWMNMVILRSLYPTETHPLAQVLDGIVGLDRFLSSTSPRQ